MIFTEQDIRDIEKGSAIAQRKLVQIYTPKLYNLIFYHLQNREEAEEVTQDTFIKIFAKTKTFKSESSYETWMYRLAVNQSLDRIRYNQRQKRKVDKVSLQNLVHQHDHKQSNPSDELQSAEGQERVLRAIEKLPQNQKTAILLTKMEGKTQKEAAEIMDLSTKAVESLIQRAKKNLREQLKNYFDPNKLG